VVPSEFGKRAAAQAMPSGWDKGEIYVGGSKLIALSFSQKFLTFLSRVIFFRRLNFSGDRLIQFIDGPVRYWLPAHGGFSPWRITILRSPDAHIHPAMN
jgi:hypothetical protein